MGQQPPKHGAAVDPPLPLAPLRGAVLVGGASRRMGRPKEALEVGGERLLDRILAALAAAGCGPAVLIGAGRAVGGPAAALPRLADAAGVEGPLAGLLAALRSERAAWVVAACDLPRISRPAVEWLVAQREAARARECWAVLPRAGGRVQPLLALYEPESRALVEELAASGKPSPSRLAGHRRVWSPEAPAVLAAAWSNANTPGELEVLLGALE